jgi:hypothetical protein
MNDPLAPTTIREDAVIRPRIGIWLIRIGWCLLGITLGLGFGYYAADQGVRWLPTMAKILLIVGALGIVTLMFGTWCLGKSLTITDQGFRLRKRMVTLACLAILVATLTVLLIWTQQPSPLTDLSPESFETVFAQDAERYREYDYALYQLLVQLENQSAVFPGTEVLTPDQETLVLEAWMMFYNLSFAQDRIRVFYEDWFRFDPGRAERRYHLRSFLLTYAAELSLYEKSTRIVHLFESNPNVVKYINTAHPEVFLPEGSFTALRQELQGNRDRARVIAGRRYLEWLDSGLGARVDATATGTDWLWNDCVAHLDAIDAIAPISLSAATVVSDLQILYTRVRHVWFPIQTEVAEWMGDTRVHRGKDYLVTHAQCEDMDPHLEPGDIMLSRKNWYLSNVGLPGFWPHAMLYIGAPDKFDTYFDTPEVIAWVQAHSDTAATFSDYLAERWPEEWSRYLAGDHGDPYRMIEAQSEGIIFNTLHKGSGDYLVAMRPRLDRVAVAQAVTETFRHLGKPYDFDFDFATDHALVCTEVVYRAYRPADGKAGITFPLVDVVGRRTLPANEIAKLFDRQADTPEQQLDFVYFLDGREKTRSAVVANESTFRSSWKRKKWSITLE